MQNSSWAPAMNETLNWFLLSKWATVSIVCYMANTTPTSIQWDYGKTYDSTPLNSPSVYGIIMTSSNGNIFHVTCSLCEEATGQSSHKVEWRGALIFSFICAWTNGWANNRDAGDWRRNCVHCDFTVMTHDLLLPLLSSHVLLLESTNFILFRSWIIIWTLLRLKWISWTLLISCSVPSRKTTLINVGDKKFT